MTENKLPIDLALARWLDNADDIAAQEALQSSLIAITRSRVKGRLTSPDDLQWHLDLVTADFFRMVSAGKIPDQSKGKVSTIIGRIAGCRVLDILRRKYYRAQSPVDYIGGTEDIDKALAEHGAGSTIDDWQTPNLPILGAKLEDLNQRLARTKKQRCE
jgi:hypothetical protein